MTGRHAYEAAKAEHRVWRARPLVAAGISVATIGTPVVAGVAMTHIVTHGLPDPQGVAATVAFVVLVVVTALGTTLCAERLTRELVPLAALFRLTLVFPDRAPARYGVALRARTTRKLELQDRLARSQTPAESADVLLQLVAKLSRHDRLTRGHSERVRAYTDLLTEELSITDEDAARLRWAALLHDVGKLAVPAHILNKPGRLTDDEFEVVMKHPERGAYFAEPLADWLGDWIRSIGEHHERWDGDGYPGHLAGEQIALGARIVSVADAFDVMTSFRTYATRRSLPAARQELVDCAGAQFDPKIVRAMLQISLPRLALVCGPLAVIASIPLVGRPVAGALDAVGRSTHGSATAIGGSDVTIALAGTVLGAALVLSGVPSPSAERAEVAAPPGVVVAAAHDPAGAIPLPARTITGHTARPAAPASTRSAPTPAVPGTPAAQPIATAGVADPTPPPPAPVHDDAPELPAPIAPAADTAAEVVAPLAPSSPIMPAVAPPPVPVPPTLGDSGSQDAGGGGGGDAVPVPTPALPSTPTPPPVSPGPAPGDGSLLD